MNQRISALIETHPLLAWAASVISWLIGVSSWMIDHANDAAKVFGVFAAMFAAVASYYTMRIQHRNFHQGAGRSRTNPGPRRWWHR